MAQFIEFKIGADQCRWLAKFRAEPADDGEIAAIQTALSAANILLSAIATVAHTIENDAIRSIHAGIHHGRSEHLLLSNSPFRTSEPALEVSPLPNR